MGDRKRATQKQRKTTREKKRGKKEMHIHLFYLPLLYAPLFYICTYSFRGKEKNSGNRVAPFIYTSFICTMCVHLREVCVCTSERCVCAPLVHVLYAEKQRKKR